MAARFQSALEELIDTRNFPALREMLMNCSPPDLALLIEGLATGDQVIVFRILPRKLAAVTVTGAEDFPAAVQPGSNHSSNRSVHSRSVSPAGQDGDAFHSSSDFKLARGTNYTRSLSGATGDQLIKAADDRIVSSSPVWAETNNCAAHLAFMVENYDRGKRVQSKSAKGVSVGVTEHRQAQLQFVSELLEIGIRGIAFLPILNAVEADPVKVNVAPGVLVSQLLEGRQFPVSHGDPGCSEQEYGHHAAPLSQIEISAIGCAKNNLRSL